MTKCDCIDPERHGHLDDCPFSEIERLRSRLADIESQNRVMWDVANDREARLADPCRTYDRDGKLLTVCHSLADAEARLADEERGHTQTIKERDHAEEMADKLADALATLLGVEIGEHSSGNCPWTAALEAFEERPPDSASLNMEPAPDGSRVLCVADQPEDAGK